MGSSKQNIAIVGKSGAGKSTIATYLQKEYGFAICNTGIRCRELAKEFFDNESKEVLNEITDSFNKIQRGIWVKVALKSIIHNDYYVIDSIRFIEDYNLVKGEGTIVIRVFAPVNLTRERLRERNQDFNTENENHVSENELDNVTVDFEINNDSSTESLYQKIDKIILAPSNG